MELAVQRVGRQGPYLLFSFGFKKGMMPLDVVLNPEGGPQRIEQVLGDVPHIG